MARALFIGSRSPLSAGGLAGWLASGNTVAEFWSGAPGLEPRRLDALGLSPAEIVARHGIRSETVPRLSKWPGLMDAVEATGADVLITCATELIVPETMLARFGASAVNLHPAMLPEYRGPTPYLPMLLDGRGDSDGGVTLHMLTVGIDEGDIIAQQAVRYSQAAGNFTDWYVELIRTTYRMLRDDLPRYLAGGIVPRPQLGGSYVKLPRHILSPDLDAARVREALARAGSTMQIAVNLVARTRPLRVTRVVGEGPRTGAAPVVRPLTLEMDFADRRLRLRRATAIDRQLARWRLSRALRPLQL